jgi:GDP-L-fucose synthase
MAEKVYIFKNKEELLEDEFIGKKVLVAGGAGLIGRQLVNLLLTSGAHVFVSDIRTPDVNFLKKVSFKKYDLTEYQNCLDVCCGMDYVFNLLCVKASPKIMKEKPASYFVPQILFNTNLLRAAYKCKVKKYLYTSSLGVYHPNELLIEDDVWKTQPSENDRFAGWAKRMGELQAEAYKIQYGWQDISIARPANTYGPYDDFHSDAAMVVPSMIKKVLTCDRQIVVWGDGSNIRDFIHSRDVARGLMVLMHKSPGPEYPVNLGSGVGHSVNELIEIITKNANKEIEIIYDPKINTGDQRRVMDQTRARSIGFEPLISLDEGIRELIEWYVENEKS